MSLVAGLGAKGATSDECAGALKLEHQTASARFTELVRAKCFVKGEGKRKTRQGKFAQVYVLREGASWVDYMKRSPSSKVEKGIDPLDQAILDVGRVFVKKWPSASPTARQRLVADLVQGLVKGLVANKKIKTRLKAA